MTRPVDQVIRLLSAFMILLFLLTISADSSQAQAENGLSTPDWMKVDHDAKTVKLEVIAGMTDAYNHWNFNGFAQGEATIVVPEGYAISIAFQNNDPYMVHSIGVGEKMDVYPTMYTDVSPSFEGAISSSPTDMVNATAAAGGSEKITFVASAAGEYALVCYIPAHAMSGMWIGFTVSSDNSVGLQSP